jgi:predicted DNA-binding antitoxin AbrB/MazE fold protein
MTKAIHATYDGAVLKPDEPLPLAPNSHVVVTIEMADRPAVKPASFLDTAMSLNLEGPRDWSERLEHSLYGERASE